MNLPFPSDEFDELVADICHGQATDEQVQSLSDLLHQDLAARDEYLWRVELHSRLASDPDLFAAAESDAALPQLPRAHSTQSTGNHRHVLVFALAACLALVLGAVWGLLRWYDTNTKGRTSNAVAMLNKAVDASWMPDSEIPRLGSPLAPGPLRLKSGLVQVVFYSGARIGVQGPAELELISQNRASCRQGLLTVEVPPQAKGFRVDTPQVSATDLGTSFGLAVNNHQTQVHVFKGRVELQSALGKTNQVIVATSGATVDDLGTVRLLPADSGAFGLLFDLQTKSSVADGLRFQQWRAASGLLNNDPSLLLHFDFEQSRSPDWRLHNSGNLSASVPDATIVGGQWSSGRWPEKRALEFQSVSDRVRLSVPGEFQALTLAAWVRVQGLDRKFNSLFMSDGFDAGTVHWLIRNDGVLGLTVVGHQPGNYQIIASSPVIAFDSYGMWMHVAVVLDGKAKRVVHYLNGQPVSEKALKINPPFRIGAAELGNWNADGFPGNDPSLIRNFSGAIDEFCVFSRALEPDEIHALYVDGKPQPISSFSSADGLENEYKK